MTAEETTAFLKLARDRFDAWKTTDELDRSCAQDDNKFAFADDKDLSQWDETAKRARVKRPILQWNRIPTYIHQVTNAGRENKPSVHVSPLDDSPPETANYFQGRIRQIQYDSDADTATDWARQQQVVSGRGFKRVKLEWVPGTQQQRICIEAIPNQFTVAWDTSAIKYTKEDSDWWFVFSHVSKEKYIRDYGEDAYEKRIAFTGPEDPAPEWINTGPEGEQIQIAEYIVAEYKTVTVPAEGKQPKRTEKQRSWCSYIIDGAQILEDKKELLGSTCQIIPVWGEQAVVDNILRNYSLIRNARTPQKNANLFLSNMSEQIGQMPKTPWIVAQGGIAPQHENDWQDANTQPIAQLYYQKYDQNGRELPPPERNTFEPPIEALLEALNVCFEGVKASMGLFDPSVGADKESDQSGVAVQKLQNQAGIGNYHFPDNESRSLKYEGEILVELIKIVDRPGSRNPIRTVDGKTHIVPIGEPHQDYKTRQTVIHDLASANVGVVVSAGPSYETARQEAAAVMSEQFKAVPETFNIFGDLFYRFSDFPAAEEIADRMKAWISMHNPGLIPEEQGGPPIPPQVQAQLQSQQAELQKVHAFAQSLHEQLQSKQPQIDADLQKAQLDLQIRKYTVDQQEETKRTLGLATINADIAMKRLEEELGIISAKIDRQHAQTMESSKQAHAKGMESSKQAHVSGEAEKDRTHESVQADKAAAQAQQSQQTQIEADQQAAESAQQNQGDGE